MTGFVSEADQTDGQPMNEAHTPSILEIETENTIDVFQ
jgi:hypothetical protein